MSKQFATYEEAWAFARKVKGDITELETGYLVGWAKAAVFAAQSARNFEGWSD